MKAPPASAREFEQLQLVYDLSEAVGRAESLAEIFSEALNGLIRALHAERAGILLFDPDGVMRFKAWRGLSDDYCRAVEGHSPWRRDSVDPAPILVADVARDPLLAALRDLILGEGIRALAFVPLVSRGALLGKFMLYYDAPHTFGPEEIQLAEAIARHIAFAVERKRTEEERALLLERAERARVEAEAAESRFRELVEDLDAIVWEADPRTWRFTYVSQRAERILGYPLERWLTDQDFWSSILHPEDRERAAALRQDIATGRGPHDVEYRVFAADGSVVWLQDVIHPASDGGERRQLRGILIDVTRRKQSEEERVRLLQQVQEADKRKDEFVAMLAHELRNPLTPVATAVELMRMHGSNPAVMERARNVIEHQVHHMVRLVDDLLDVARITSGKIHLRKEAVELSSIVNRAVDTNRTAIEARQHELSLSLPESKVWLVADPLRLEQVLGNLLNNAAKYTEPHGQITVTARVDGSEALLSVRDTGLGLSPEMQERIFEMFVQDSRVVNRSQGGLGIGLTLVRMLVEMHGGAVQVTSPGLGQGSEFIVRLPVGDPPAPHPE